MEKALYSRNGKVLRQWLKERRLANRLSMRSLAAELGVPFQFISKVEKGERRLDVVEYVAYCEALGVNPSEGLALIKLK